MPPPHPHVHTPLATAAPPAARSSMSSAPQPIDRHMVWLVAGAFFALTLCAAGLACWWKWGCNRKRRVRPEEDASAHRQHRRLVLALEKQAREHAARYQPDAPPIPRPTLALAAAEIMRATDKKPYDTLPLPVVCPSSRPSGLRELVLCKKLPSLDLSRVMVSQLLGLCRRSTSLMYLPP